MSKPCKSLSYVLGGSAHTGAHVLPINAVRSTADHLITAGRDGAIAFYDSTAQLQNHIQLHSDWANDVLMYNSTTVVSCSSDLSVKWWDVESQAHGLVGHHGDYVKALARSGNHVLSGGLDKCINIWDIERKEVADSFLNEYGEKGSIYAMGSSSNGVVVFGDNVGNVQLFDVRSSQVVSTFVGHTDTVKALVVGDDHCLSGSSDGTVRLWDLRNKQEPLQVYDNFDGAVWALYSTEESSSDDFYTGTSTGAIYHTQQNITKTIGSEKKGILSLTKFQEELWSSTMNDSGLKNWNEESKSKEGDAGLIKCRMLNNRRHVVTLGTDNTVVLWDILRCCRVREYGADKEFEDVVEELQTNEILPTWCSTSIRAGKLFVTLRESSFSNTEVYGNDLDEYGLQLDRDTRYNLGKILIKSVFVSFVDYEIQKDQQIRDFKIKEIKGSSKLNLLTKFSSHESSPAHTPTDEMKGYFSDTTVSRRASTTDTNNLPPSSAPDGDVKDASASFRRLKLFSRKSSKISATLSEEGESETEPLASSISTLPTLSYLAEQKEHGQQQQQSTQAQTAPSSVPGSKDSSRKSSHTDIDSLATVLAEIRAHYDATTNSSLLNSSQIIPPSSEEVPVLSIPQDLMIIINERIQNSSSEIDVYSEEIGHMNFQTLETLLSKWIGNFLLKNRVTLRDYPKVGFVVKLHPGAESTLPGVTNGETRLNAYSMLRVRRVLSYITDRLESKPVEVVAGKDPETWLEAVCRETVLDNNMTLATLRSVIWKQSGDVVITYRRKQKRE